MKLEEFKPESWTDAEFTRVDFYGPLVKAVSLRNTWHYRRSNLDQYQLVDAILTSPLGNLIRQYLRDHTIFPNLQTIWGLCNGGYELHPAIDWELHLAPTSLHELDVGLLFSRRDGKKQDENLFIEAVLKRCPGLEVLKLHAADSSIDIDEWCDIFTDFSLLQRLYELRVSGELVCQSMFEWVSKLPSLQILEIGAASCHNLWLSLQELEPKNGRSIELIQLNTVTTLKVEWDLSDQIALLPKYCSSPHLLALSLDDAYLLWSPKKHSFASLISCQSPKIKKLTIGATADSGLVRAERLSLTQWFDGFRLLDLSELHIAIALDVSDKTYFQELNDRIANYWPRLEYLSWESQTFTFQEVAEIISHFPHIASLSFKTMRDPWIRPTNILPSISTQPLKLYCHLADCCDIDADAVVG